MLQRHSWPAVAVATTLIVAGCSNDDQAVPETPAPPCDAGALAVSDDGIGFQSGCQSAQVRLKPSILVNGVWIAGQACRAEGTRLSCDAGTAGSLVADVTDNDVVVRFEPSNAATVEAIALEGDAVLPTATSWLSNGFQSWSQSGVLSLGPAVSEERLASAVHARGDAEVDRWGDELSWWYTYVGANNATLFAGALTASRLRSWTQVFRIQGDALRVRMVSGGAGEKVHVDAGDTLTGERWRLGLSTDGHRMLQNYARDLSSRRDHGAPEAEAGWNSWYELWDHVTEQDIRDNAALASTVFEGQIAPGAALRIVIDDGWQQMWGEWEPNEKFPSGMDGLAADLKSQGHRVGIWLAPLLVDEDSELVAAHPDWFVQGAAYDHTLNGRMLVLDPTHPEAAAHLRSFIERIVSWGYDFLKIDFLFAGTFEGQRHENVTGIEAYHAALREIRQAAGEHVVLLAVGAPSLPTFEYVDAWRIGGDIAFEPMGPSFAFVVNQARNISARWHLCSATLCDGDPPLLRKLGRAEVETGVWVAALAGGAMFLSDDLRDLPQERRTWGLDKERVQVALSGEGCSPTSLFPADAPATLTNSVIDHLQGQNRHVVAPVWRTPAGTIGFNFSDAPAEVDGLALPAHGSGEIPPPVLAE